MNDNTAWNFNKELLYRCQTKGAKVELLQFKRGAITEIVTQVRTY